MQTRLFFALLLALPMYLSLGQTSQGISKPESHRPQFHFTPKANWMNDPNGMVYYKGTYHLFFQYYPDGMNWGPMHWGHTTSSDLVHWQQQPIALYPDSLGYIFSGSVVVDDNNTSGFGKNGQTPLVAIFTHHNPKLEKLKTGKHEYQSLAYSLDEGKTWTKYTGNPVLPNPGITDFRDPKVRWYEPQKKWIMTLATKDRVTFYSSPNLKKWTKESDFGKDLGAHGGVWECPDLFPLEHKGKKAWVLLVSINPGGPNGGSATQYFVGDFDGKSFKPYSAQTKWVDYGPDDYAGVTFANTGNRTIFMGWMSNWQYAGVVPTSPWRSASTVPRELGLKEVGNELFLTAMPVKELNTLNGQRVRLKNPTAKTPFDLLAQSNTRSFKLDIATSTLRDFSITLANEEGNELLFGYDQTANAFFIDRSKSGKIDFEKGFGKRHYAPRSSSSTTMTLTILVDVASIELFADEGLTVMTDIFFPESAMTKLSINSETGHSAPAVNYVPLTPTME